MARCRTARPGAKDDEYTNEYLNQQYFARPVPMESHSEGCRGYVRQGYHTALTRAKYRDANWME